MRTGGIRRVMLLGFVASIGIAGPAWAAEVNVGLSGGATEVTVERGGEVSVTLQVGAGGAIACTTQSTNPSTAKVDEVHALSSDGSVVRSSPSSALGFWAGDRLTDGSDNCNVTWQDAPIPYPVQAKVRASSDTPVGDYPLTLPATIADSSSGSQGKLKDGVTATVTVHVVEPVASEPSPTTTSSPPPTTSSDPAPTQTSSQPEPAPAPTEPEPELSRTEVVVPVKGSVLVRLPNGRVVRLDESASLPNGSIVDATKGVAEIVVAASAQGDKSRLQAWGGAFRLRQGRGARPITDLALTNPLSSGRKQTRKASASKRKRGAKRKRSRRKSSRMLWARGKGRFRTRGRNASAVVRGTKWLTKDTSRGTLVVVRSGKVAVRDRIRRKTVVLTRNERYLAKPRARRR